MRILRVPRFAAGAGSAFWIVGWYLGAGHERRERAHERRSWVLDSRSR